MIIINKEGYMIKAIIFSIIAVGISSNAFAERKWDVLQDEQFRQYQEQQKCLKSPEYCEEKAKLYDLQLERLQLTKYYSEVKDAVKNECARIAKMQRATFDPMGNKYPQRKHCSEFASYNEAKVRSAEAPALKAQLQILNDRIQDQTVVVAELAARL